MTPTTTSSVMHAAVPAQAIERAEYRFVAIHQCNMCGSAADAHELLGKRLSCSQGLRPRKRSGVTVSVMRCRKCGLVFSNPQPVPLAIESHYDIEPEAYWSSAYFEDDPTYFAEIIEGYERLRNTKGTARVLDVGCGLGKAMVKLQKAGYEAFGVEASPAFHAAACKRSGLPADRFMLGEVEKVDFPAGSFDLVTFAAVLEHLRDPDTSLRSALRWLKPGGLIYVQVPSAKWLMYKIINSIYRLQGADYVGNLSPMHPPFHLYEFALETFEIHGERHGYEIADRRFYVCGTYAPRLVSPLLNFVMERTDSGMQLEVWLRKRAA